MCLSELLIAYTAGVHLLFDICLQVFNTQALPTVQWDIRYQPFFFSFFLRLNGTLKHESSVHSNRVLFLSLQSSGLLCEHLQECQQPGSQISQGNLNCKSSFLKITHLCSCVSFKWTWNDKAKTNDDDLLWSLQC